MKKETITFEIQHCAECSNISDSPDKKYKCKLTRRRIQNIWDDDIPDFCPLEDA